MQPTNLPDKDSTAFLDVGRVVAPFGLAGEVRVLALTDFPERFAEMKSVLVGEERRKYRITGVRSARGQVLLKLSGVNDPDAAEALRGAVLRVPIADAVTLGEDQYFWYQIIDLGVDTTEGRHLGKIVDIIKTGANDVYVVRGPLGELLIPAIEDVVREVDLAGRHLVVELLPGLIDEPK